jgi:hypothetical protein
MSRGPNRARRLIDSSPRPGIRAIGLTRGHVALVDEADYERLSRFNWYAFPSTVGIYAVRGTRVGGKYRNIFLHQEVLGVFEANRIDHKNQDGLDNRRENLRLCERFENMRNRRKVKAKTSAYKGVYWKKRANCWESRACIGDLTGRGKKRKQLVLGRFQDEIEAARAYDRAAVRHFGSFAVLNGV